MSYERKDMTFSLFPNKDRKTDKHPDMSGTALVDGVQYFADAWTNVDRNGNKYISGKLKPKEQRAAEIRRSYGEQQSGYDPDPDDADDLPF
ncbi:hypothetical protein [Chelativorans xinjiangense]|uniref:hypothetical protein n=1 Tax=Chelativorans xinjiangense TaxID=2681485 RepID=UPI00135962F8|nr:hypothetical protein [Chelativorans xinjiangense]